MMSICISVCRSVGRSPTSTTIRQRAPLLVTMGQSLTRGGDLSCRPIGAMQSAVCVKDVCSLFARDRNNLTPLNLALRNKRTLCASFLLTKQWSKVRQLALTVYVIVHRHFFVSFIKEGIRALLTAKSKKCSRTWLVEFGRL